MFTRTPLVYAAGSQQKRATLKVTFEFRIRCRLNGEDGGGCEPLRREETTFPEGKVGCPHRPGTDLAFAHPCTRLKPSGGWEEGPGLRLEDYSDPPAFSLQLHPRPVLPGPARRRPLCPSRPPGLGAPPAAPRLPSHSPLQPSTRDRPPGLRFIVAFPMRPPDNPTRLKPPSALCHTPAGPCPQRTSLSTAARSDCPW